MRSQYASTITPPAPAVTLTVGSTTSVSAGTKSIWIYCRNRAGITLFSPITQIAIAPNQGLEITLPSAIRKTASDIREIGVVMSSGVIPEEGCVVAIYPGYEVDGVTLTSLPYTIAMFTDAHFLLRAVVPNPSSLPSTSRINGMRRYVESTNQIVQWVSRTTSWDACLPQSFNPYIADTLSPGGADCPLPKIVDTSAIIFPDYDSSGELSQPVKFWLVNDTNFIVPQGKRIRISVATDPEDVGADDFKGLLQLAFLGYANTVTGEIDTTEMVIDSGTFTYQGDGVTILLLPKPLAPNYAYILQVQMAFDDADSGDRLFQGDVVKIYPRLAPNFSEYDPNANSDYIVDDDERRRILAGGTGLDLSAGVGSGVVAFYRFRKLGKQLVPGAESNKSNQKVIITNNGTCFVANSVPSDTAALRAIIGTVDGVGGASAWSVAQALSTSNLISLNLTHPNSVRSDYPDAIAGMADELNATQVRVYVRLVGAEGAITVFDVPITRENQESILVGSLATSAAINLPIVESDFGLFAPPSFTISSVSGTSIFATGNYQIAIAYLYNGTVTSISHSSPPCITEFALDRNAYTNLLEDTFINALIFG